MLYGIICTLFDIKQFVKYDWNESVFFPFQKINWNTSKAIFNLYAEVFFSSLDNKLISQ